MLAPRVGGERGEVSDSLNRSMLLVLKPCE